MTILPQGHSKYRLDSTSKPGTLGCNTGVVKTCFYMAAQTLMINDNSTDSKAAFHFIAVNVRRTCCPLPQSRSCLQYYTNNYRTAKNEVPAPPFVFDIITVSFRSYTKMCCLFFPQQSHKTITKRGITRTRGNSINLISTCTLIEISELQVRQSYLHSNCFA